MNTNDAQSLCAQLRHRLNQAGFSRRPLADGVALAFLGGGHALLRDFGGSGSDAVPSALAGALGARFLRVPYAPGLQVASLQAAATAGLTVFHLEGIESADARFQIELAMLLSSHSPDTEPGVFFVASYLGAPRTQLHLHPRLLERFLVDCDVPIIDPAEPTFLGSVAPPSPLMDARQAREVRQTVRDQVTIEPALWESLLAFAQGCRLDDRLVTKAGPSPSVIRGVVPALQAHALAFRGETRATPLDLAEAGPFLFPHQISPRLWVLDSSVAIVRKHLPSGAATGPATPLATMDLDQAWAIYERLEANLASRILGRTADGSGAGSCGTIELILTALLARGHVLLEDYPGSGKTLLANTLGLSIEDDISEEIIEIEPFHRIQCTPDLLPSDITGYLTLESGRLEFRRGPIFAYIVLLDEINRTTPKVQSATLEAMAEGKVTVDDKRYPLGQLFFVIATQNPIDRFGTYELPAAQLDRFLFKRRLSRIGREDEAKVIRREFAQTPIEPIPVSHVVAAREAILSQVPIPQGIQEALLDIADALGARCRGTAVGSRTDADGTDPASAMPLLTPGSRPSTRSLEWLMRALQVQAFIEWGRNGLMGTPAMELTLIPKISADFLRHRIFIEGDVDEDSKDRFLMDIVQEVIAVHQAGYRE